MTISAGERLVVDASVVVKWVVPEPGHREAELLLEYGLVAPDLLFAECANILWKKIRRGELTGDEAEIAGQTLEQADLTIISARAYLSRATAIAVELDHPAYDGIYLAIAEALGLRLVTADDRLIRKVNQSANRFQPRLVALSDVA